MITYINNLSDVANNYQNMVTFKLFADDAKLYSCINNFKNVETMQHCLDSVLQWEEVWQLTLSVAKCKILVLGNVKFSNVYKFDGTPLLMLIIILILVLLWTTNLHLNCM